MVGNYEDITPLQDIETQKDLAKTGKRLLKTTLTYLYSNSREVVQGIGQESFFIIDGPVVFRSPFSVDYDFSPGIKEPSIFVNDEMDPATLFDGSYIHDLIVPMPLYESDTALAIKSYRINPQTNEKKIWFTALRNPVLGINCDDSSNLLFPYVLLDFDSVNRTTGSTKFDKFGDLERKMFDESMKNIKNGLN
ncbi:MAG: hypothetical protein KC550_00305 [Nanoarchaeota archaeon]|nr:hypothetical protein [Nanoarchaeota archaeon]